MTLTDFLLARIAEDEEVARGATPGPWYWDHEDWEGRDLSAFKHACVEGQDWGHHGPDLNSRAKDPKYGSDASVISSIGHDSDQVIVKEGDGRHIARHDPSRVLRECQAKRQIVEYATNQHTSGPDWDLAVAFHAEVYADHPDYREEWRPWP